MIRGSWCSKSRPAKAAGAEVAVQQRHEKWHAAVARSTFVSQNVQKHLRVGPIFEIQMSKNRTPLSHLQVKMYKTPHVRSTFWSSEVKKNRTPLWREVHLQVKMCEPPAFWDDFGASDVEKLSDRRDR